MLIYPSLESVWYVDSARQVNGNRKPPIDSDTAKKLLQWEEEQEGGELFRDDYLLKDRYGKKIRCLRNVKNRPLYLSVVENLVQEILRNRWVVNGEPIIIGQNGIDLNGQHQLVSVVLAEQDRIRNKIYWEEHGVTGPVSIEKLVVFGIEETDAVVNTMDTCKPRSLADVIYRSPYFAKSNAKDRHLASSVLSHAIRLFWIRTGVYLPENSFALRRTHSESIDLIERHKRLIRCCRHILEQNHRPAGKNEDDKTGVISDYVPLGYAVVALYLMSCSTTDSEDYYKNSDPDEKSLKWDRWEKACEFWSDFCDEKLDILRKYLVELSTTNSGVSAKLSEKDFAIVKAWELYLENYEIKRHDVLVKYTRPDEHNRIHLKNPPNFGGIDLGMARLHEEKDPSEQEVAAIEARKKEVELEKSSKKS